MTSRISDTKYHPETKTEAKERCNFPQKAVFELKMGFLAECSAGRCRWTFVTVPGRVVTELCLMWLCFISKYSHPTTAQAFPWSFYKESLYKKLGFLSCWHDPNWSSNSVLWVSFRRVWNNWGFLYQSREEILHFLDPRKLFKPLGFYFPSFASGRKSKCCFLVNNQGKSPAHSSRKQI